MTRSERIKAAMWAGDLGALEALAPCVCCCHEHTFANCEAREWGGCRSGLAPGETLEGYERGWQEHYAREHGMSEAQFYGWNDGETHRRWES